MKGFLYETEKICMIQSTLQLGGWVAPVGQMYY